jgi:hypothetical protein
VGIEHLLGAEHAALPGGQVLGRGELDGCHAGQLVGADPAHVATVGLDEGHVGGPGTHHLVAAEALQHPAQRQTGRQHGQGGRGRGHERRGPQRGPDDRRRRGQDGRGGQGGPSARLHRHPLVRIQVVDVHDEQPGLGLGDGAGGGRTAGPLLAGRIGPGPWTGDLHVGLVDVHPPTRAHPVPVQLVVDVEEGGQRIRHDVGVVAADGAGRVADADVGVGQHQVVGGDQDLGRSTVLGGTDPRRVVGQAGDVAIDPVLVDPGEAVADRLGDVRRAVGGHRRLGGEAHHILGPGQEGQHQGGAEHDHADHDHQQERSPTPGSGLHLTILLRGAASGRDDRAVPLGLRDRRAASWR